MQVGTQFTGTVAANSSVLWFTHSWPRDSHVVWTVVPVTPGPGAPQIEWNVAVQSAAPTAITYWITVKNLTAVPVAVEGRFEILS